MNKEHLNQHCKDLIGLRKRLVVKTKNKYKGRCFEFYMDVKKYYPQSIALYDGNHTLVLVDGVILDAKSVYLPFKELEPEFYELAKEWHLDEETDK